MIGEDIAVAKMVSGELSEECTCGFEILKSLMYI
jgi:hypothetical protein